jgi:hypothetical protein
MAADTVSAVRERGIFGMTSNVPDMAFRANARPYVECRELRRGSRRKREKRG